MSTLRSTLKLTLSGSKSMLSGRMLRSMKPQGLVLKRYTVVPSQRLREISKWSRKLRRVRSLTTKLGSTNYKCKINKWPLHLLQALKNWTRLLKLQRAPRRNHKASAGKLLPNREENQLFLLGNLPRLQGMVNPNQLLNIKMVTKLHQHQRSNLQREEPQTSSTISRPNTLHKIWPTCLRISFNKRSWARL